MKSGAAGLLLAALPIAPAMAQDMCAAMTGVEKLLHAGDFDKLKGAPIDSSSPIQTSFNGRPMLPGLNECRLTLLKLGERTMLDYTCAAYFPSLDAANANSKEMEAAAAKCFPKSSPLFTEAPDKSRLTNFSFDPTTVQMAVQTEVQYGQRYAAIVSFKAVK